MDLPAASVMVLPGHASQYVWPGASWNSPALHREHSTVPVTVENRPDGQSVQLVAPTELTFSGSLANVPWPQLVHTVSDWLRWNLPPGHAVHAFKLLRRVVPCGHRVHSTAPTVAVSSGSSAKVLPRQESQAV